MYKSGLIFCACVLALAIATNLSIPNPDDVTMSKYLQLQTGMSYSEAVDILGKSGTEISSGEIVPGYKIQMFQWFNEAQTGNMNATFQNDRLTTKAQFGLR